jgi:hypothetical protein
MKIIVLLLLVVFFTNCSPKDISKLSSGDFSANYQNTQSDEIVLKGLILDKETKEPIIFGNIALYKEGGFVHGTESDFDGNFKIAPLSKGIYSIEVSYLGYQTFKMEKIKVKKGQIIHLNVQISDASTSCPVIVSPQYRIINKDNTTQGQTLTKDQIRNRKN